MTKTTRKTYPVSMIARYFLSMAITEQEPDLITNLKLQKLCYYAYGVFSVVRKKNEPQLFNESIEAWMHGAVIPKLYDMFKKYEFDPIPETEILTSDRFNEIDTNDRGILRDVFDFFGQFSAWKLRNMNREEEPWKNAYSRGDRTIISHKDIKEHFNTIIAQSFIKSYRENESINKYTYH